MRISETELSVPMISVANVPVKLQHIADCEVVKDQRQHGVLVYISRPCSVGLFFKLKGRASL